MLERKAAHVPPGSHGMFGIFSNVMQATDGCTRRRRSSASTSRNPGARRTHRVLPRDRGERRLRRRAGTCEIVEEVSAIEVDEAVLTGGAAKGTLWPQILADVLGVPVRIPVVKESTALGAAIYAGVGAGIYDDAARRRGAIARFERTFEPTPGAVAPTRSSTSSGSSCTQRSLEISEAGLVRPLWRAAGT